MPKKASGNGEADAVRQKSRKKEGVEPTARRRSPAAKASQSEQAKLEKIWSRRMALCGLKRIVEAALAGARIEVCDEDGALVEVKFNPTAANAATKAIETANRMLGYTVPDEKDVDDGFVYVDLGDAEEFAE